MSDSKDRRTSEARNIFGPSKDPSRGDVLSTCSDIGCPDPGVHAHAPRVDKPSCTPTSEWGCEARAKLGIARGALESVRQELTEFESTGLQHAELIQEVAIALEKSAQPQPCASRTDYPLTGTEAWFGRLQEAWCRFDWNEVIAVMKEMGAAVGNSLPEACGAKKYTNPNNGLPDIIDVCTLAKDHQGRHERWEVGVLKKWWAWRAEEVWPEQRSDSATDSHHGAKSLGLGLVTSGKVKGRNE